MDDGIPLRPFSRQVGGHFLVLEMSKDRLCKPLVSREKLFYDTIPSDLKEFAPGFYGEYIKCPEKKKVDISLFLSLSGVMLVQIDKDEKGNVSYTGSFVDPSNPSQPLVTQTVSESSQEGPDSRVQEEEELQRLSHLKCSLRNDELKAKTLECPFTNGKP